MISRGRKLGYKPSLLRVRKNKEMFLIEYETTFNLTSAIDAGQFCRKTYYNYYQNDVEFRDACDSIREDMLDMVENELFKLIKSGNFNAIKYFLSSKGKDRGWGDDTTTLKIDPPVTITYICPQETKDLIEEVRIMVQTDEKYK